MVREKTYLFRREDNGEVVEVDFATMMSAESGFITLPDGVSAKRCVGLEIERDGESRCRSVAEHAIVPPPILSDSLGFPEAQLQDFEADRKANGFTDVEFVRDKHVPQFFQVKFRGRAAWRRYVKHRGMVDKSRQSTVALSEDDLRRAGELLDRVHEENCEV